jgi:hypothetical protein
MHVMKIMPVKYFMPVNYTMHVEIQLRNGSWNMTA